MDVNEDLKTALEAVAEGDEADSSSDADTDDTKETQETKSEDSKVEEKSTEAPKGKGAQDRIRELVDKTKTYESDLEKVMGTLNERDTEIGKLVDLLEMKENDSRVVQKINELHADPRYTKMIEDLDKLIRGEEVEADDTDSSEKGEKGEKSEKNSSDDLIRLIAERDDEVGQAFAEQQADLILHKADILTDKYIEQLPEEYTEDDKRLIQGLLADHIDWDSIEEDPDSLIDKFAEGFEETLEYYGTPKGMVSEVDTKEDTRSSKEEISVEDLVKADWGKLKTVKTPEGKEVKAAAVSDEDFTKALAEAMRRGS